jgi:hypothetical protein
MFIKVQPKSEVIRNTPKKLLITILILILIFFILILIYDGSIDDFVPKHIAVIHDTIKSSHLSGEDEIQIPGFYALGSIICLVSNIDPRYLILKPFQMIPYALALFILIYRLCPSLSVAFIFTFIDLISSIDGTARIFFWPHGLASALFYILLFLLIRNIEQKPTIEATTKILLILIGISLIYMSYDLFLIFLLFILSLSTINFFDLRKGAKNEEESYDKRLLIMNLFNLFAILIIVQLGLSKFAYDVFFPLIQSSNYIKISGIDKLILSYWQASYLNVPPIVKEIALINPKIISIVSLFKYIFLILSIIFFLIMILRKKLQGKKLNINDSMTIALIIAFSLWVSIRFSIGQIAIGFLYWPAIFSLLWLFRFSNRLRIWAIFVTLFLLFSTPLYYYLNSSNDLIDKDKNDFNQYELPAIWYFQNKGDFKGLSDEFTNNFFTFNYCTKFDYPCSDTYNQFKVLSINDIEILLARSGNYNIPESYFILNYNLNSMSLANWFLAKSWIYSDFSIESNSKLNKFFDSGNLKFFFFGN